ncbi:hypothetical protein LSH36_5g05072 [Paralvinella palmiformis]|uniref:Protein kinase domain-containing protein n=1 Tax=Paralvinella palmiformis TaxID=53620 RepID=A0AAD9KF21_9ANNE|nr:hypothetical protein LSH36_5g05072 [Paralvinella palmiformis]
MTEPSTFELALSLHYRRPDAVKKAIQEVHQHFMDFTFELSTDEYENERREELVVIRSNLSICNIKKSVPVRVWLPLEFPLEHPIAEIIHTRTMLIYPSGNVDGNNKIRHPYLNEWTEDSNLADFIQILIMDFMDYLPVFDFTHFNNWRLALPSVKETLRRFPELIPSWKIYTYENKETVVLELTGPILMAGQCCVNIRVLLSSDFPIKVPEIYLMSDDRMSPKITNITDNNGKCIHSCISNWYHPENSLCELLQCLVEEYRAECAKKEHSAASHISFQDREPRLERTPTTNEMPHLTSQPMPRDAGTSQPTRSVSNSSPPCYIGPQPPQPAPRRCNSQNVEIQDFIKWANLPEMIEHQLIKNGFTMLRTMRCINKEDLAKLELSLADLCLLRESLTTLRDGRYESYNNSNRSDSVISHGATPPPPTAAAAPPPPTTAAPPPPPPTAAPSTTTTSNMFCRGLRRLLDPLIVKKQQLDLGIQLGKGNSGIVYKGWLKRNVDSEPEIVAVKTIIVSTVVGEKQVDDFVTEILQMSTLKHRNVIELKAFAVIDEIPYLVLPFMPNGDLLEYVKDPHKRTIIPEMTFVYNVYLFRLRTIFSLIISRVDADCNVKISDFGMARQLHKSDYIKLDDTKIAMRWMAPEIFNEGKFSLQSDVVITLGKRPYEEIRNTTLLPRMIMTGYRMSFPDYVPGKVQQIVAECWQMEAERRPSFSNIISCLNETLSYDADT